MPRSAIPAGSLTLESLAAAGDPPPGRGAVPALHAAAAHGRSSSGAGGTGLSDQVFSAPGRLARVGLAARLVDAGLVPSLLLRGRVPGGTAAAASVTLRRDPREATRRIVYHGRVVREDRWVVLQYMFFYAMNDWRSTFEGANDHEADWEQCFVVLEHARRRRAEAGLVLRRRARREGRRPAPPLGRPELQTIDGHPVVYPGAGSHADVLRARRVHHAAAVPGRALHPRASSTSCAAFWRDTLDQPDPGDLAERGQARFSVPFVDYARGDGIEVGPGGDIAWTPDPDQRRRPLGRPLPRPVGPGHGRPVRRRARPGRPEVHADRRGPPVLARPARVRRPRQGRAAVAGGPGPRGAPRGAPAPSVPPRRRRSRRSRPACRCWRPRWLRSAVEPGVEKYRAARAARAAHRRGEAGGEPDSGRGARDGDRGGRAAGGRAAGRAGRRSARPSASCRRPRAARRHEAPPASARPGRRSASACSSPSLAVVVWFRILPPGVAIVVLFGIYLAIESFLPQGHPGAGPPDQRRPGRDHRCSSSRSPTCASCSSSGLLALGMLLVVDNLGEVRRRTRAEPRDAARRTGRDVL